MAISNTPNLTTNPVGIAPVSNMPIYFVSAATPLFSNNALNIDGGSAVDQQPIVLWALGYTWLSWGSSWMLTPEGMIRSTILPQMVLGINSSNVVLCNRDDSDQSQYWTIAGTPGAYTIQNKQTQEVITAPDTQFVYSGTVYCPPLTTAAINGSGSPGQLWAVQPVVIQQPPNNQFYIQTAMSGDVGSQGNPYMIAADTSNNPPGAIIYQWQPGEQSQLWIFNADGTIASVSLSSPNSQLVLNAVNRSQVTLLAPSGSVVQQWTYSDNQISVNMGGSIGTLYLNVAGNSAANNTEVLAWVQSRNETWYTLSAQSIPIGEWFYLETEMTAGGGNDLTFVLTIPGTVANAGTGVVIEPLQPGAFNQLWQINAQGVIISALNPSMALTAVNGKNQPVTLQPIQSSQPLQQWYRLGNGMIGVGPSGYVWYLNVSGGGNAVSGTQVIAGDYQYIAPNVVWNTIPYIPEPSGLWFTIQTALAAPGAQTPYLLTAFNATDVGLKPPLGGYILPQGQAAINQLWRKTLNGNIVSAINPNLVLTGATAGGDVSLAPLQPGSADQQWFWGYSQDLAINIDVHKGNVLCGVLQNSGQNQVLWAPGVQTGNVTLQPAATVNDTDNQLWFVLPHAMPFGESTTIRNVGGADEVAGLFLSLPAKPTSGSFAATVNQQSGNPALSMWQFQFPGYIVSGTDPDIVLSLEIGSGATVQNPAYSNNVVAYPRQPGAQPFQLWVVTPEGLIVNQYNGQALAASAASAPSSVITTALSNDPKTNLQLWDFSPGMALQTTLAQPPVSYPAWTSNQTTAYKAISKELGLPDGIRAQYANLAAPLNNYQLQMNMILLALANGEVSTGGTKPSKDEVNDWISVVTQLNKEITAVAAVQLLFQQVTALHLSLGQAQAMTLSELITGCALPNGLQTSIPPQKKKRSWIGDLVEGLTYTALNVVGSFVDDPGAGKQFTTVAGFAKNGLPCIANLMSTGFATSQGVQQTKGSSTTAKYEAKFHATMKNIYNYEMTVLEMQQELLNEFEAVGSTLGQIEAIILADWGKLQVVYDMTRSIGTMSSLYWPSTMTPIQANQMLSGYTIGVLQTLLPLNTKFKNSVGMHANYGALQNEGQPNPSSYIENNDDGTQNSYSTTVNEQMLAIIWTNGVEPNSFFRGMKGWTPPEYQVALGNADTRAQPSTFIADIIITIQNFTNQELSAAVTDCYGLLGTGSNYVGTPGNGSDLLGQVTRSIAPYGLQTFAGTYWLVEESSGNTINWYIYGMGGNLAITANNESVATILISTNKQGQSVPKNGDISPAAYTCSITQQSAPYTATLELNNVSDMYFYKISIGADS